MIYNIETRLAGRLDHLRKGGMPIMSTFEALILMLTFGLVVLTSGLVIIAMVNIKNNRPPW